jgi:hypothetical protein
MDESWDVVTGVEEKEICLRELSGEFDLEITRSLESIAPD